MDQAASSKRTNWKWMAPLGVLVTTAVAYWHAYHAGFTNWDDKGYVTQNQDLLTGDLGRLITEPCAGNFHPLTMLSLWLNFALFGLQPFSFHALNVALHLGCTLLAFQLGRKLGGGSITFGVVTGLVFGLHPVHVESVAWISERKDVLFALFYLAGMLTYLRYLVKAKGGWLLFTLLLFIFSLLSKPTAVTFPLILFLLDYLGRRKRSWRMVLEKIPFFLLSIAIGVLTLHFQAKAGQIADFESRNALERLGMTGVGFFHYLSKTLLPVRLAAVHPNPPAGSPLGWAYYVAPLLFPLWLWLSWRLRAKARLVSFAMLFFLVAMLPTLQFISFGEALYAERYLYVPILGAALILAWLLDRLTKVPGWAKSAGIAVLGIGIFAGTFLRCQVWDNSLALWNDTIAKYPGNCFTALICRADLHIDARHPGLALLDAEAAIRQRPYHYFGFFSRGNAYYALGEYQKSLEDYTHAISIYQGNAILFSNRSVIYFKQGDFQRCIADLDFAIGIEPRNGASYYKRSQAFYYLGNIPAAKYDLSKAMELGIQPSQEYLNALNNPK